MIQLSEINIYPIKSCKGLSLTSSEIDERGLKYDRRWMLLSADGRPLSQRRFPNMSMIHVDLLEDKLLVSHDNKRINPLKIPFDNNTTESIEFEIWKRQTRGNFVSKEADSWFSEVLETDCRLLYMPDEVVMKTNPRFSKGKQTSFTDGYPFLLIGGASLEDLNARLEKPLSMDRFRPSLIFSGGEAYDEDHWKTFRINSIDFHGVKLCDRCTVTTVDQDNGIKGKEPLATLNKYRRINMGVYFGQNVVHDEKGVVSTGDEITVVERGEPVV